MEDLNLNEIAASVVQKNFEAMLDGLLRIAKGARSKLGARFGKPYHRYLASILQKHSAAKSFFIRQQPTPSMTSMCHSTWKAA